MSVIRIQKNPKRKVRIPETGEELEDKKIYEFEDSVHWRRRIQSGDVIEVFDKDDKEEKEKPRKAAEEKPEEKKPEGKNSDGEADKEGEEDKGADGQDAAKPRGRPKSK